MQNSVSASSNMLAIYFYNSTVILWLIMVNLGFTFTNKSEINLETLATPFFSKLFCVKVLTDSYR